MRMIASKFLHPDFLVFTLKRVFYMFCPHRDLYGMVRFGPGGGGGGALKLFFDGGVPHETLKWGS